MADATLSINIVDDGGDAKGDRSTDGADADILARYRRLLEQMARATDETATRAAFHSKRPPISRYDPVNGTGTSAYTRAQGFTRTEQTLYGVGPGGRTREQLQKLATEQEGRPKDSSDEEWLWYSRESAKRGKVAGTAARRAREQNEKREAEKKRQADTKRDETTKTLDELVGPSDLFDSDNDPFKVYTPQEARKVAKENRASERAEEARKKAEEKEAARRKKLEEAAEKVYRNRIEQAQKEEEREQQADERAKGQRYASYTSAALQGASGVAKGEQNAAKQAGGAIGQTAGSALGEVAGAAVGGPIGAAVGSVAGGIIGKEIGEKIGERIDDPLLEMTKGFRLAGKAVDVTSEAFQRIAKNDSLGLFKQSVDVAAQGLEEVPIVGKSTAEAFRTLSKTVTGAYDAVSAFAARGRELSGYSGALAKASAQQDVQYLLQDIREARRLGGALSKNIDAQTRFDLTLRELLLPIKEVVADKLPQVLDLILKTLVASLKVIEFSTPGFVAIFGKMSEDIERIRKEVDARVAGGVDVMGMWINGVDGLGAPAVPEVPAPAPFPPRIVGAFLPPL